MTPAQLARVTGSTGAIGCNLFCCFVMTPLISVGVASFLGCSPDLRAGIVLLGCVSGGQASNLCALLAGGDVALSVVLTLSTTCVVSNHTQGCPTALAPRVWL